MARDTRFGQQIKTTQKKQASEQASKQAISPSFLQLFQLYRGKHTHRPRSHGQSIKIRKTTALKKKKKDNQSAILLLYNTENMHTIKNQTKQYIYLHKQHEYNKKSTTKKKECNIHIYIPIKTNRIGSDRISGGI